MTNRQIALIAAATVWSTRGIESFAAENVIAEADEYLKWLECTPDTPKPPKPRFWPITSRHDIR